MEYSKKSKNHAPLDDFQAGSLQRIVQLANQLPDDWSGMLGPSRLQEDFGGLRFQLGYMAYSLALTHVHRMPAAPNLFKSTFSKLIEKILSPDVWLYWHYVSTGDGPFNKSLGELPAEWNPVGRDNIMYSAYVQSMALMYHYVFRDDKYSKPGALTFSINPLFWALGGKHFEYDEKSLNEHLYWMMVESGYLGIACEPNCVFQICNQPAIIGFKMHDFIYGTSIAEEVTEGYLRAWEEFGLLTDEGQYTMMVMHRERMPRTRPDGAWADFWLGTLMNSWNSDFVKEQYPNHLARHSIDGPNGTLFIRPQAPILGLMAEDAQPYSQDFGWAVACASEIGDEVSLLRLLNYADNYLHPTWSSGAYYYQRHDEYFDTEGRLIGMDPHTGNCLIGYGRLNVPGGLNMLYNDPLPETHFTNPILSNSDPGLDLRQAYFDELNQQLHLSFGGRLRADQSKRGCVTMLEFERVPSELPKLYRDGQPAEVDFALEGKKLVMPIRINPNEELVLKWE